MTSGRQSFFRMKAQIEVVHINLHRAREKPIDGLKKGLSCCIRHSLSPLFQGELGLLPNQQQLHKHCVIFQL